MRGGKRLFSVLALAFVGATASFGAEVDTAAQNADRIVAQRLANDALDRSRIMRSAPGNSADEATILLAMAHRLDPDDPHILKLLAEASKLSNLQNKEDLQREALRQLIRVDPGDLVAQVTYIDLMAGATQAIDERARIYRGALDSEAIHPQIRSEMAARLGHIAAQRGDTDSAIAFCKQALTLNDVNIGALRELARLAGGPDKTPQEQLAAIIALLNANPLQPDAWVSAAGVLASGGVHDRAADFLVVALEQMQIAGQQPAAELYLTLVLELASAGRKAQAYPLLNSMAKLPDAPLSVLVAARLLAYEYTPATRPASASAASDAAATPLTADQLTTMIRKRLKESVGADPKSAAALSEAAWIELSGVSDPLPETATWMKDYAALVPEDDATLARLNAWQLLRQGKQAEAQAALEKLAATDPLARLGLVRILLEKNKRDEAAKQLQELWATPPGGLLAFQIAQTARAAQVTLTDSPASRQLGDMLRTLVSTAVTAHRTPRDTQLVVARLSQRTYAAGDPVLLSVNITNSYSHAAPVGPDGLIKTSVGLSGVTRGMHSQAIGMFAVEDLQRVFRLERGDTLRSTVRVDQGVLADLFQISPIRSVTIGVTVTTSPRPGGREPIPGLGGQAVAAGDFERGAVPIAPLPVMSKLVDETGSLPLDKQLLQADILISLLDVVSAVPSEGNGTPESAAVLDTMKSLHGSINGLLLGFLKSPSPSMRAWMTRLLPGKDNGGLSDDINAALARTATDPEPVVRIMWGTRQVMIAGGDAAARTTAADVLEKQAAGETDPLVRRWFTALADDLRIPPPASQPATAPAR